MAGKTIDCDILIVGGGIAGPGLACAVRDRGYTIVMVEAVENPWDTSRGDHIQPIVVEILERWGALDTFKDRGAEIRLGTSYYTADGDTILDVPLEDLPIPHPHYLVFHHEMIGQAFMDLAAENPNFHYIAPATSKNFETAADGSITALTIEDPDGGTTTIHPKIVIGADGRGSKVRDAAGFTFAEEHQYVSPLVMLLCPRNASEPRNEVMAFLGAKGMTFRIARMKDGWKISIPIDRSETAWWRNSSVDDRKKFLFERTPAIGELETHLVGFYPCKLATTSEWARGNVVLAGDACHGLHPAHGQGLNIALRDMARFVDFLPEPKDMAKPETVRSQLQAYDQAHRPIMMMALNANHERALEMDYRDPDAIMATIPFYQGIQDNPQMLEVFKWLTAGYPPPSAQAAE